MRLGSSQPQHVIASQKLICSSDQVNVPGGQAFPLCQIPPSRSVFGTAVRNSDKISSKSPIRTWERTIRSLDVAISGMLEKIKPKIWNPLNLNSIYTPQPYTPSFQWTPRNIAAPASYELPDGITTSLFHSESGISIITAAPSVTAQPLSERTIESKSSSVKNVSSEGSLLNTETEGQGAVKTSLDTDYSVNPTSRSSRNCSPTSEYPNPAPAITTLSKSASSQSEKYFSRKSGLSKSFRRSNTPTHFSSVRLESEAQRKKFVEAYNQLTGASTSCGASKGDCELASDMPSPALPSKTEKALSAKAQRPQATLPDTFSVNNITEEQKLFFVKTYNEVSAQGKARLEENMRKYNLWELLGPLVASKVPTDNVYTFSPLGSSQNLSKAPGILISNQTSQSNLTLNSTPTQTVKLNFNGEKRDRPGSLLPLIREMAIAMLKSEPLSTAVIMAAFGSLGFSDDVLIMSHLQSIANYSSGPTGLWHLCEKKAANSSQKVSTESSPSVGATKLLDDRTRSPSLLSTNSQSNAQQDAPVHSGNQSSQFSNIPSFSVSEPIESVKLKLTTEQHNAETIPSSKLSLPLSETLSEESLISRINPALFNETCASSNRTPLNTSASTIRPQNMSLCGSGKPIFLLGGKAKPVDLEDKKLKSTFSDPSVTSIHQGSQVRQKEQILKIASSDFQNSIASEKTPSVRPEDQQSRSSSTELNLQLAKQPSTLGSKLVMMESEEQQSNTTPVWLKSSSQMLQGSYLKPQSALNYEIDIGKRKRNQTRQIKKSIKYCEPYKDDLPGFPDVNPSIQIKGTRAKILLRYPHDQQMAPIRTFYPLLLVEKSNS
ncbi:hypothetical protein BY996DRAFT_2227892 [Phakopsora pachyrhizi]|nr:hypothetical protein BY996DRAFT_2227892 [Phakopsora pachyrhizi]